MPEIKFVRWGQDLDAEFKGKSDRGVAIVGAAMLDAQLRVILQAHLAKVPTTPKLFDAYAPLSSFSGKIDLCLGLGLISSREHRNLTLLRRIRNYFAHGIGSISFSASEVENRCNELDVPEVMRFPEEFPLQFLLDDSADVKQLELMPFKTPRDKYQVAVLYISNCLNGRLLEAMGYPSKLREDYERPSQIAELHLAASARLIRTVKEHENRLKELKESVPKLEAAEQQELVEPDQREELQDKIAELEAELSEIRQHPSFRLLQELGDPMMSSMLKLMKRWEATIEQ